MTSEGSATQDLEIDSTKAGGARLGGARADFVASLGRKIADVRELLLALEKDSKAVGPRDELRRKLQALGSGARILRFDAMARALQQAGTVIEGATVENLGSAEINKIHNLLRDLPELAWDQAALPKSPPVRQAHPSAVLFVGSVELESMLGERVPFEYQRTDDAQQAIELARSLAPDAIVIEAEVDAAEELVDALLEDPLTEPVPLLVVGNLGQPSQSARFIALGVAKTLAKPFGPELYRRCIDELLERGETRKIRLTLGEPTVEQLSERLAQELKRAMIETLDKSARRQRVPLGEGSEVLGALWGAIARVQQIVTDKTAGAIQFSAQAPECAIAFAPWITPQPPRVGVASDRESPTIGSDISLQGRRILVADDDPGVTWFLADLLRSVGCEVYEALDGKTALETAYKVIPDAVLSDILMPKMDGFLVCRALKRDIALRDTPVILISWKEDLLQRLRDLGANAAGYITKEMEAQTIVACVRNVLRPRLRVENCLKHGGDVQGRLDQITPRLLLQLVADIREDALITVRDASFAYEVAMRGGMIYSLSRSPQHRPAAPSEQVLRNFLGIGTGRFRVDPLPSTTAMGSTTPFLGANLAEQLMGPITTARAALEITTGTSMMHVTRLFCDRAFVDEYVRSTPSPAREIVERLAAGASPRSLVVLENISPALVEEIVADLAARGAIQEVRGPDGLNILPDAVQVSLAMARGEVVVRATQASSIEPISKPIATQEPKAVEPMYTTLSWSEPPPRMASPEDQWVESSSASSLEDALIRELSDNASPPSTARISSSIIEPGSLRPRPSHALHVVGEELQETELLDAIDTEEHTEAQKMQTTAPLFSSEPRHANSHKSDVMVGPQEISIPVYQRSESELSERIELPPELTMDRGNAPRTPLPTVLTNTHIVSKRVGPWKWVAFLALFGVAIGSVLRFSNIKVQQSSARPSEAPVLLTPPSSPPEFDIPAGVEVKPGHGVIEVALSQPLPIRLDGVQKGKGPKLTINAPAGRHDIQVGSDAQEVHRIVEVRSGRMIRVDIHAPP